MCDRQDKPQAVSAPGGALLDVDALPAEAGAFPARRFPMTEQGESDLAEFLFREYGFTPDAEAWRLRAFPPAARLIQPFYSWRKSFGIGADAAFSQTLTRLHGTAAWCASGKPVFRITSELYSLLKLTELDSDIPPMPFDGFKVEFPPNALKYSGEFITEALIARLDSRGERLFSARAKTISGAAITVNNAWDESFSESIQQGQSEGLTGAPDLATTADELRHVVRGMCSFIVAGVEPLRAENHKAVERDRAAGKVRSPVFVVGKTVKLSPQAQRYLQTASSGAPLWRLKHRYMVRGHFRWQPVGERLKPGHEGPRNAKKVWIEPHWKGPDGAEAWQHFYEVDAPQG